MRQQLGEEEKAQVDDGGLGRVNGFRSTCFRFYPCKLETSLLTSARPGLIRIPVAQTHAKNEPHNTHMHFSMFSRPSLHSCPWFS